MAESASVRAWKTSRPSGAPWVTPSVATVMSRPLIAIEATATLQRGRIVAIVSDRDIHHAISPWADGPASTRRDDETLRRPVYSCATYAMRTIQQDAPIQEAAAILLAEGISALPVVGTDGGITGIVTARDLLRELLACHLDSEPSSPRRGDGGALPPLGSAPQLTREPCDARTDER
jgi:CBS domain-containing protein